MSSGKIALAVVALVALLAGCKTKYLAFATYTKIGLDVAVADGTPTQAVFGYKRFEGAVVPVQIHPDAGQSTEPEAMSVYAAMDVTNGWTNLSVTQVFATGEAAKNAASKPEAFANLVRSVEQAKDSGKEEK